MNFPALKNCGRKCWITEKLLKRLNNFESEVRNNWQSLNFKNWMLTDSQKIKCTKNTQHLNAAKLTAIISQSHLLINGKERAKHQPQAHLHPSTRSFSSGHRCRHWLSFMVIYRFHPNLLPSSSFAAFILLSFFILIRWLHPRCRLSFHCRARRSANYHYHTTTSGKTNNQLDFPTNFHNQQIHPRYIIPATYIPTW